MNFNRIFNKIHTQPAAVGQSGSSAPSTGKNTSAILLMNIAASVVLPSRAAYAANIRGL